MPSPLPILSLAHSGDPDDAFMWWPLTGKVDPDGTPLTTPDAAPRILSPRFQFRAVPGDIAEFNTLAARDHPPYDITALSVRAYADAFHHYRITRVGSSFGEGYGPKVVCLPPGASPHALFSARDLATPGLRIGVPGLRTTAVLALRLMLREFAPYPPGRPEPDFVELPFDEIIPNILCFQVDAGLVIHEGQILYEAAGLTLIEDLGAWWGRTRHGPLPLGINAVKRDLDARYGPGSLAHVSDLLHRSLAHALANREESIDYTMPYAERNAASSLFLEPPTRAEVERYLGMYVTSLTADMGDTGRAAIDRLLAEGAAANLCPPTPPIDPL